MRKCAVCHSQHLDDEGFAMLFEGGPGVCFGCYNESPDDEERMVMLHKLTREHKTRMLWRVPNSEPARFEFDVWYSTSVLNPVWSQSRRCRLIVSTCETLGIVVPLVYWLGRWLWSE